MSRHFAFSLLVLAAIAAGCDEDDSVAPVPSSNLVLNFTGLEPLAGGYHYEGWAILGGPVSTGKFDLGSGSQLVDLNGVAIANNRFATGRDLSAATAIVITIELPGDTDAIPAATKYLGGNLSAGSASLSAGHAAALGNDFMAAIGKYILATPTNGNATNENSGIWFLSLASGSPAQGLFLPVLPSGWRYEGWVVIAGTPVTTGAFLDPAAGDLSAPYSDSGSSPPFPGEDFLLNAPAALTFPTDIANGRAVISIEPDPDPSPAPFTLKPLNGLIPAGAVDHVTYDIANVASQFPTGSATIQ
jgi:hypothetical protein